MRLRGLPVLFFACVALQGPAQEFRGFWADAFHTGFKTPEDVSRLVADVRAANCNAVLVEVRKRGDAYYHSNFEPLATEIAPDFDPLQDLLNKAHDTNTGPRVEVHAWLVTYPIWTNKTILPVQTNHPFRLHPDWLTQDTNGNKWVTNNYVFDPGHPAVLQHTFNVAMDVMTNYADIDGINFDYIRYPESGATITNNPWGYNPVSVERYNRLRNHSGQPRPTDPDWLDFRREQVTALLRKIYLTAMSVRPGIKVSADTVTWASGVTTDSEWVSSAAPYVKALQDWRAWMEEGILDLNIPMNYFRQNTENATDYAKWSQFAKDHRYNRHVVIGPGIYLNMISNGIFQMRMTRDATPSGNHADGVCGYSYAVPASNTIPNLQATFMAALTRPSAYDSITPPIFATRTTIPSMPWKMAPTNGHLKGTVVDAITRTVFDGLAVALTGATNKAMLTDGTGFYGAVDLLPGNYQLSVNTGGYEVFSTNVTIIEGNVTSCDLQLVANPRVVAGASEAIVSWTTLLPSSSQVEYYTGTNTHLLTPMSTNLVLKHSVLIAGLAAGTTYCCVAISGGGEMEKRSDTVCFTTAGTITLDNVDAELAGSWTTGTSASDKYLTDYAYSGTVSGLPTRIATYRPAISSAGLYDVYTWYSQGNNRSANAPHVLFYDGGSVTNYVDQQMNGGGWRLLAAAIPFAAGTDGCLQIANNTGESGKVVIADGVQFVYSAGQEPPSGFAVPRWWSQYYFASNIDTLLDYDNDGYPAWAEYWLGVDPTDQSSCLEVRLERFPEWRVVFSPYVLERRYQLQSADEPTGSWETLSNLTVRPLMNNEAAIYITLTNGAKGYYRLKVDWNPSM